MVVAVIWDDRILVPLIGLFTLVEKIVAMELLMMKEDVTFASGNGAEELDGTVEDDAPPVVRTTLLQTVWVVVV